MKIFRGSIYGFSKFSGIHVSTYFVRIDNNKSELRISYLYLFSLSTKKSDKGKLLGWLSLTPILSTKGEKFKTKKREPQTFPFLLLHFCSGTGKMLKFRNSWGNYFPSCATF
jgi:hypothetical protein